MAKSSKEFLSGLTALADDLRKQIDANLDGWDTSPAAIAERRRKVCDLVNGFEYWDRNYFPHYGKAEPSVLHQYLYKRLPEIVNAKSGQRDAIAAPRGEAKSTKVSMSFVTWCLVTSSKWYAIIVMDAFEQEAILFVDDDAHGYLLTPDGNSEFIGVWHQVTAEAARGRDSYTVINGQHYVCS